MSFVTPSLLPLVKTLKNMTFSPILERNLQSENALIVDLSTTSKLWDELKDGMSFEDVIAVNARMIQAQITIGRYNEERTIYQGRDHFAESPSRSLHIGIDLGVPSGVKVQAPLDGCIHSFADNSDVGDYGPTIILQHNVDGIIFHTLYEHLSRQSLQHKAPGMKIKAGMVFATIGNTDENGGWAPHLHFQIINDIQGQYGDYPGVVDPEQADYYLANCPDPNLILKRPDL
ncbi:peptidoglycan DD-metalloendopeptidase family protein [Photobacterium sp. SDRW27]|uniref:peptidoglycan DD-metalloendopeptidase family protein n=1 Tax=Photobacterium obscurum TaxID=2829490 RepID=UPI0022442D85|nr:peptidoglycan DD-metalloendopeptidase family protein [Photobacterium obscurum]MCW8330895.1 peptidoglycan DD-metalloendopeptidase family protein [Photobacterium obscurum]